MIGVVYHKNIGPLLGEIEENLDGTLSIKNPTVLIQKPEQVFHVPFLSVTKENTVKVQKDELFFNAQIFEPADQIRYTYSQTYGVILTP